MNKSKDPFDGQNKILILLLIKLDWSCKSIVYLPLTPNTVGPVGSWFALPLLLGAGSTPTSACWLPSNLERSAWISQQTSLLVSSQQNINWFNIKDTLHPQPKMHSLIYFSSQIMSSHVFQYSPTEDAVRWALISVKICHKYNANKIKLHIDISSEYESSY